MATSVGRGFDGGRYFAAKMEKGMIDITSDGVAAKRKNVKRRDYGGEMK